LGKLISLGGVMGGLLCARNGGVAKRDSTMAAPILRMDHNLMSGHGMNDEFSFSSPFEFLGMTKGKSQRDEIVIGIFGPIFSGEAGPKSRP
jgi:hypothetical protein